MRKERPGIVFSWRIFPAFLANFTCGFGGFFLFIWRIYPALWRIFPVYLAEIKIIYLYLLVSLADFPSIFDGFFDG
jgi:hypothetical protein